MLVCVSNAASAFDYNKRLRGEINVCDKIDPNEHVSGLYNNPEGFRSFYKHSACIQRVATRFRDKSLCDRVRRKYGFFNSSWGYSESTCEDLVKKGVEKDRGNLLAIRDKYRRGPVTLSSLKIEQNGNRRDYDFVPSFADGFQSGYTLEVWLTDNSGGEHLLLTHGAYLRGTTDNIRIFRRRSELQSRFRGLQVGTPYQLEARLILSIGIGGPAGWLRDDLVEEVFPANQRTQALNLEATFE